MSEFSNKEDFKIERWLSIMLRGGVNTALALLLIGMVINYTTNQSWMPATDVSALLSGASNLRSDPPKNLAEFIYGFNSLQTLNFVQAAILVLILLPGFRVAFLLGSFVRQRDWIFSALALLVLIFMSVGTLFPPS